MWSLSYSLERASTTRIVALACLWHSHVRMWTRLLSVCRSERAPRRPYTTCICSCGHIHSGSAAKFCKALPNAAANDYTIVVTRE